MRAWQAAAVIGILPFLTFNGVSAQQSELLSYKEIRRSIEFADAYGKGIEHATNQDLIYLGAWKTNDHPGRLMSVKLEFFPQGAAYEAKETQEERERLTARWSKGFCNDAFRGRLRSNGIFIATGVISRKGKVSSIALCPSRSN